MPPLPWCLALLYIGPQGWGSVSWMKTGDTVGQNTQGTVSQQQKDDEHGEEKSLIAEIWKIISLSVTSVQLNHICYITVKTSRRDNLNQIISF